MKIWPFPDEPGTISVTLAEVSNGNLPILFASHERDEDGEVLWQFHNDPARFDFARAQLVRLDTIFKVDPTIGELSDLPVGWSAVRKSVHEAWKRMETTG